MINMYMLKVVGIQAEQRQAFSEYQSDKTNRISDLLAHLDCQLKCEIESLYFPLHCPCPDTPAPLTRPSLVHLTALKGSTPAFKSGLITTSNVIFRLVNIN